VSTELRRLRNLYVAVVADTLDGLGRREQTLAPGLIPLGAARQVMGRAATLGVAAVETMPDEPYVMQFAAVDALEPGDVMVVAGASETPSAFWGELITTRAMAAGCSGVVVDGYTRDLGAIQRYGFPLWARGAHPADAAGRLEAVSAGEAVRCAGALVEPGDVIFGDLDGVVVIPSALVDAVLDGAEEKVAAENAVRADLRAGRTVAATYADYGVM
jgi:4-hydroxy-4-methyl-2-oxoglutarate aldolase